MYNHKGQEVFHCSDVVHVYIDIGHIFSLAQSIYEMVEIPNPKPQSQASGLPLAIREHFTWTACRAISHLVQLLMFFFYFASYCCSAMFLKRPFHLF